VAALKYINYKAVPESFFVTFQTMVTINAVFCVL